MEGPGGGQCRVVLPARVLFVMFSMSSSLELCRHCSLKKLLPKPRSAALDAIQSARIRVSCLRPIFLEPCFSSDLRGISSSLEITRKEDLPLLVFTAQPSSTRQVVYGRNYTLPLAGSWGVFLTPWSLVGKGDTLILAQCTRQVDLPQLVVFEA